MFMMSPYILLYVLITPRPASFRDRGIRKHRFKNSNIFLPKGVWVR